MTNSQFQLFPPPAPQGVPKNPFRKGTRRTPIETQSTISSPFDELKNKNTEAKAVVFEVVEPNTINPPPEAHVPPLPPRSSTPELRQTTSKESLYSSSPQAGRSQPAKEGISGPDNQHDTAERRPASPPKPSVSPVVPIKSIFPQLNPNAVGQQQHNRGASSNSSRPRHRPARLKLDITPAPEIDRALGPVTVPGDVYDFPASVLSPAGIQHSSSDQLKVLWEATNGQRTDDLPKAFSLRMER